MITCIYLLSGLCLLVGFKRKLYISACYLFFGHYFLTYYPLQANTDWKDYYLASFLLFFSLGSCFHFNLPNLFINSARAKNFIKKSIFGVSSFLCLLVNCRVVYRWIFIQKTYVNIRYHLALNMSYWERVVFFAINLFVLPLFVFSLKNKYLKIFFWLLCSCILWISLCKALVFYYCLICLFSWFLLKTGNINVSKLKVALFLTTVFFSTYIPFSFYTGTIASPHAVLERLFPCVKRYSYVLLDYSYKNKLYTYGSSSFYKLYHLFSPNKERIPLEKRAIAILYNIDESTIQPGRSAGSSTPVSLYVDFGWFALIFAFLLGTYLKTVDILMINFCRNNKITLPVAIAHSCCVTGSTMFLSNGMGATLLSAGMFFYSVLLFLFINLDKKLQKVS